jgi:hypothetical protein
MGIDKGNTNYDVMLFDSIYGIHYPGVSGDEGGGNAVHLLYDIQGTPTVVVIAPDKHIASHAVWPPATANIVDSVLLAGGVIQDCITGAADRPEVAGLLTIHGNPVKEWIHFTLRPGREKELEVTVWDLAGRRVAGRQATAYPASGVTSRIDASALPDGLYFIQVLEKGHPVVTRKIIIR